MRIVECLEFCDTPARQHVAWLVFQTVSSYPSEGVCITLLHGGWVGETDTAEFSGIIQSEFPSNSTLTP